MFIAATLAQARADLERARAAVRAKGTEPAKPIHAAVAAMETAGVAYAIGAADRERVREGRAPDEMTPLLVGAALHAFALFRGSDDSASQHAQVLGNGAIAACAYRAAFGNAQAPRAPAALCDRPQGAVRIELTMARLSVTSWP